MRWNSSAWEVHACGVAAMGMAILSLLSVSPATALADRGDGSIRAADRSAPETHAAPAAPEPRAAPVAPAPRSVGRAESPPAARMGGHTPPRAATPVTPAGRDWDDNDQDLGHGGGFVQAAPSHYVRGQHFHDIPHHVTIAFANRTYFCDDDGNYYEQEGSDYVVVQPPVGATLAALPPGADTIVAGPTTYYYLDGTFYVAQNGAFVVVNPPPGIVVPGLPSGANQVVVNGNVCYQFNGFNYQPCVQDGVTAYIVNPM